MDPGTILGIVDLVQRVIEIYQRVDDLPSQMARLGRRVKQLNVFLVALEGFVKEKRDTAYSTLFSGQKKDLANILARIKENVGKTKDLFERYEKGILSQRHNLQFRVSWFKQVWFTYADNSVEKIQAIMDDIDDDRALLRDYMHLMQVKNMDVLITAAVAAAAAAAAPSPGLSAPFGAVQKQSPSPSPAPPRKDYSILFVDVSNIGRSVVGEAVAKLIGLETQLAGRDWRVAKIHSAGFFVKNRSDVVDVVSSLDYSYPSWKKPISNGGQAPQEVALAAVFDNKSYNYPFKEKTRSALVKHQSRGMTKDTFKRYDFILVFTNRDHDNTVKLKQALRSTAGETLVVKNKGRIVHLGAYLRKDGPPKEIAIPKKNADGTDSRYHWNGKVAEIKTAIKAFLKQEMKWVGAAKTPAAKTD